MHYVPDRWVMLTIKTEEETIDKVFAGWFGGFAGSDTWKLSSGVVDVTAHEDHIEYKNHSGSVYLCRKDSYGMTSYMNSIYQHWLRELDCEITLHDKY
jgi:hypothetical protein